MKVKIKLKNSKYCNSCPLFNKQSYHFGVCKYYKITIGRERRYGCRTCYGSGAIVHPDEKPDIIEGHKLSKRIPCPVCDKKTKFSRMTKCIKENKK